MVSIDELKDSNGEIGTENIKKIIPYEKQFLFIDKVLSLDKKRIVAARLIRKDEEFLKGHFAGFPIMPGALIAEGVGQAGTLLVRYNIPEHENKDILAYNIKKALFKYPAFPGQQLRYDVELKRMNEKGAYVKAKVFVDNFPKPSAEVKFILAIVDRGVFRGKFKGKAVLD